jgi:hypothetical protein
MSRRRSQNQNFDSLLDTMANVVGILVVVMAFTQIHVGEAVRRIQEVQAPAIAEQNALAQMGARQETRRLDEALDVYAKPATDSAIAASAMIARLDRLLTEKVRGAGPKMTAREVVVARLDRQKVGGELESEISQLRDSERQLRIRLRDARSEFENAAHRIRLPDPRPAPLGTKKMVVFCRYGRVVHVDLEGLNRRASEAFDVARSSSRHNAGATISTIVRHFHNRDIGNESFRWRLQERGRGAVYSNLEFRSQEIGEHRQRIAEIDSRFQRGLFAADPNQRYVLFYVWSDSFSAYLRARGIAEEMGYSAGWKMRDTDEEYGGYLSYGKHLNDPIPID